MCRAGFKRATFVYTRTNKRRKEQKVAGGRQKGKEGGRETEGREPNRRAALLGKLIREERNRCFVPRTSDPTWHEMPTQQTDPVEHKQQESVQRRRTKDEKEEGGWRTEKERAKEGDSADQQRKD